MTWIPSISSFDKSALRITLNNDLFRILIQEMAFMPGDFITMAQGDVELANDLKDLYASFHVSREIAQKNLDLFCAKWELEKIII